MKMKSARAFYFALCPFAVAAFTGYMLALMQGNKPLVLAGVCSTIQGKIKNKLQNIFHLFVRLSKCTEIFLVTVPLKLAFSQIFIL